MEIKRLVRPWGIIFATLLLVACQHLHEPQSLEVDNQWLQGQLKNGLQYHLLPVSGEPVSLRLLVHTGAVDETAEQAGYAHFLEHMAFLGSAGFGAKNVESLFVDAGVSFGHDLNAFTTHDVTSYQIDLPNNQRLESAMTWLGDIATGKLTLEPGLIENEKGAVLGEFRFAQRGDKPAELKVFEALLQGSRYEGRDVLGTQDSIKSLSRDGLQAFYHAHYLPQKTELIITGDIDRKQLEPMISRYFGESEQAADQLVTARPQEEGIAGLTSEPLFISGAAGQQAGMALLMEFSDSQVTTDIEYQALLLEDTVIRAIAQRLKDRHIEAQSPLLNSFVSTSLIINRYIGEIVVEFAEADRLAAQLFFAEELASLRDHGVGDVELATIKETWRNQVNSLDTQWLNKKAVDFSEDRLYTLMEGKTQLPKEAVRSQLKQFVALLDKEKLNKAIKQYLSAENNKPVLLLTREENTEKAKATFAQFQKQFSDAGKELLMASSSDTFPLPEKGGEITSYEAIEPTTHRWTLENGIEVWLRQMPEAGGDVHLYLMSSGGMAALQPELHPAAKMVGPVFDRSGLAGFSASELDKLLLRHNTYLESVLWETSHGLYSETGKQELPFALSVLNQAITAAKVNEQQFTAVQHELVIEQDNWLSSPFGSFVSQVVGTLYPSESPMQIVTGDDFAQVTPDQVQAVFDTLMRKKRNYTLVVSADIEVGDFNRMLRRYVAGIDFEPAGVITDYRTEPKVSVASKKVAEAVDNTINYELNLFSQGEPKTTRDRFTSELFYRLLDKRYRDELRNAQGLSYDPYVQLTWFDGSGEALVAFLVNAAPDKLDAVRTGTQRVLDNARKGFTAAEYAAVKSQLAADLKLGLTNPHEQARILSSFLLFGADPQAVIHPEKIMSTLTLAEVNALSVRLIGKDTQQMEAMLTPKEGKPKA
ncbi:insulinase family protein [Photobacterium sp. SDRW27]|uniref:M16 family metallopeptidase n=1 Tax=Photobacterium obscurum TaxID=2829490 RepID=UPI002244C6D2|nr:M16 family metallopeptidase [Photobacterium obscurum]MCW8330755.1 insulinase family protein [Photobacterium obscurum]